MVFRWDYPGVGSHKEVALKLINSSKYPIVNYYISYKPDRKMEIAHELLSTKIKFS